MQRCANVAVAGASGVVKATQVRAYNGRSCSAATAIIQDFSWQTVPVGGQGVVGDSGYASCRRKPHVVTCVATDTRQPAARWRVRAGSPVHACGSVTAPYPDTEGGAGVAINAIGLGCSDARSVARQCIQHQHVAGWTPGAYLGDGDRRAHPKFYDEYLGRSGQRIDMRGVAGGAPHCLVPALGID